MGGDGVSMPTILSQLGNVAKTLARNQQSANTSSGVLAPNDREEIRDLKKVPEAEKAENRILERRRDDSRRRHKSGGNDDQDDPAAQEDPAEEASGDPSGTGAGPGLGSFIDRKA